MATSNIIRSINILPYTTNKSLYRVMFSNTDRINAIHTSSVFLKSKVSGRHSPSIKHDKPLTYEQANIPDKYGVRKSWNSINACNLKDGLRKAETSHEDVLIRKFLHGTWPKLLGSDVIIKRRANQIICSFMFIRGIPPRKVYFLVGYSEEILSYILKSVVKLEIQSIDSLDDMIYKYI